MDLKFTFEFMANGKHSGISNNITRWFLQLTLLLSLSIFSGIAAPSAQHQDALKTELVVQHPLNNKRTVSLQKKTVLQYTHHHDGISRHCFNESLFCQQVLIKTRLKENLQKIQVFKNSDPTLNTRYIPAPADDHFIIRIG